MRRTFGFPVGTQVLSLFRADADLKAHPRYRLAKEGDQTAALDLVIDLAVPWLFANEHRFSNVPCIFVAPHAKEASGDNAIPQTLAAVCAAVLKGGVDSNIVQTDRVFHTGADAMERMATRASFEGAVVSGARYVLVDDVTNLGGTLAELSHFIQFYGGLVHDVVVLVNAGRNPSLVPRSKDVRLIQERFQHEFVHIFNTEPAALTANEAGYLVDFKSVDAIRNRRAKAEQEIDRRLRSKGIARAPGGTAAPAAHQQSGLTPPAASLKPNPPTRTPGAS